MLFSVEPRRLRIHRMVCGENVHRRRVAWDLPAVGWSDLQDLGSVALPCPAVILFAVPNQQVVLGWFLLFEGQHSSQFCGCLDHQAFHFGIRYTAVAWLVEERRGFARVEVFQEAVAKGESGEGVRLVADLIGNCFLGARRYWALRG